MPTELKSFAEAGARPTTMTDTIRVLVPLDSQDPKTVGLTLGYAVQIAKEAKVPGIILLTHTKAQLDGTGLSGALGAAVSKALSKGQVVRLPSGASLRAETLRTLRFNSGRAVVIAYYADESLLDFVDGLHGTSGVVAVPWVDGEADGWAARWNAQVHGKPPEAQVPLIDDPIVVRALETLTSMINLSSGLGHPRDKEAADEILRILRAKGHPDPSADIKSWAIRNKWSPVAASELQGLATKIWSLKTKPSLSRFHDPDGRYDRWRSST